ncbi:MULTISPECIES: hypothetical protein [Burkholderia]|uniref:Uncharacterized protein n=1 Tax=Burkholderia anthina TaxID=179879 RepID=A0ABS2B7Y8_9BURK|nr:MULTISPECIES: hypothetical protein [Burkholderia]MBM2768628.1 hypothetical protein [Burkholderia anthina]QTD91484.1 hypothetical protein J4G50_09015 [Burkholderia anthina]
MNTIILPVLRRHGRAVPVFETVFRPMHLRPRAAQLDGIDRSFSPISSLITD